MNKILFTDLDWTILNRWVLSSENKATLSKLSDNNIEIVVSTWKWLSRVDEYFKNGWANQMILENWAKIQSEFSKSEINIRQENYDELLEIMDEISNNIEFLFFYDSKNDDKPYFYVNSNFWINEEYMKKFSNILENSFILNMNELNSNIKKNLHNLWMLNIKTTAKSIDDLWLWTTESSFNIIFNEWMLNIWSSNKWIAINQVLTQYNEKIDNILVAWNDKNDLPMIDEIIKLTKDTNTNVWVIIVWNLLDEEKENYKQNTKIEVIDIGDPNNIYIWIQDYFNI